MSLLVLTQPGNRVNTYGHYTAEVLRGEGFADLTVASLDAETLARLADYDAVVLTTCLPRRAVINTLVAYVQQGGRLIILRPSRLLAMAFGLAPTDTVAYPAYVRPLPGHPISAGVPHESLQTHLPADNYEPRRLPEGAREVARLPLLPGIAARRLPRS